MTIDITLSDKHELRKVRDTIVTAIMQCASLPPDVADRTSDAIIAGLFSDFAGVSVYFPAGSPLAAPGVLTAIESGLLAGKSCRQIATEIGVSHTTVAKVRSEMMKSPALNAAMPATEDGRGAWHHLSQLNISSS